MQMMKALIYQGIKKIAIEGKPIPELGPKDALVKIKRAGICATDLTAYMSGGDSVAIYPGAEFGHEMVGVVTALGNEVYDISIGMRVFVNPMTVRGPEATERGGAFSEFILVENAQIDFNIFILPDNMSFDEAVVIEPFSVGLHGKNIPSVGQESNVVIFGAGAIGLCVLAGLIGSGVSNVAVVAEDNFRLNLAKEMGAVTFDCYRENLSGFLSDRFGQVYSSTGLPVPNVDVFIDCAGAPSIPNQFLNLAKPGAKLSVVAVYKKPIELAFSEVMWHEAVIMGSFMYTPKEIKEAIRHLEAHNTGVERIVTHHFPYSKIVEAFDTACDQSRAIKVVLDFDLE